MKLLRNRQILLALLVGAATHVAGFAPAPAPALQQYSSSFMAATTKTRQPRRLLKAQLFLSKTNQDNSDMNSNEIRADAESALSNVGWSLPQDGDLTSDDPFVQAINDGIQRDIGVQLDELLNPAKVVNLERDLHVLRSRLAELTGATIDSDGNDDTLFLTTERCDAGGGGDDAEATRNKIRKKEADLIIERRSVFRGWLKNVFLVQAVGSFGLSFVMATHPETLFGGFDWFYSYNMDISIKVLGYWWWWLFVVPSLRSRRPKGFEKKALDIAFLGTPLISLVAPALTRDTAIIWALNLAVVAGSYGFAFATNDDSNDGDDSKQPEWLKFIYKSLDFGTGRERGARN